MGGKAGKELGAQPVKVAVEEGKGQGGGGRRHCPPPWDVSLLPVTRGGSVDPDPSGHRGC